MLPISSVSPQSFTWTRNVETMTHKTHVDALVSNSRHLPNMATGERLRWNSKWKDRSASLPEWLCRYACRWCLSNLSWFVCGSWQYTQSGCVQFLPWTQALRQSSWTCWAAETQNRPVFVHKRVKNWGKTWCKSKTPGGQWILENVESAPLMRARATPPGKDRTRHLPLAGPRLRMCEHDLWRPRRSFPWSSSNFISLEKNSIKYHKVTPFIDFCQ